MSQSPADDFRTIEFRLVRHYPTHTPPSVGERPLAEFRILLEPSAGR